ncbi:cytochrome P450 [Fennellomyces sp. T-0311]|nr:cytochrome P450 [Fennellomyces sp. T-0311]
MTDLLSKNNLGSIALAGASALGLLALTYRSSGRKDNVPVIPGAPIFGTLFQQISNKHRMLDYINDNFEKFNAMTIYMIQGYMPSLGITPTVVTIHPDNVEHILKGNFSNYIKGPNFNVALDDLFGHGIFNANGEQWRYQRKAASLTFNVANFRDHFTEVFVKELDIMSKLVLDKTAANGEPIDFHDMIYKFTLESFVQIGFGRNLDILCSNEPVPFAVSFDICQENYFIRLVDPFTNLRESFIKPILHPTQPTIKDHLKTVNDFAYTLIDERAEKLNQGIEYKDLLSRFMNARNESNEPLNRKELRDTVLNFIIAGRDTTAQTLSWTFHRLLQHPSIESRLVAEVDKYITDEVEKDAPALYEVIKGNMVYAHAVLYEALRLEPSVPVALEDDILPDGTFVRKGEQVMWSSYSMARSTKNWGPDAKEFRPERWITPGGELRHENSFKWPTFHAGPRTCLGQNLATLEALVALSLLLKRYKFSLVPGQNIAGYCMSLTHPMKHGMKVFVEKRL